MAKCANPACNGGKITVPAAMVMAECGKSNKHGSHQYWPKGVSRRGTHSTSVDQGQICQGSPGTVQTCGTCNGKG